MQDCKELDILSVATTVGSEADAHRLARALLQERLAACVQVEGGVRSFYRWQGQVHEDTEWRLLIKTLPSMLAALQAFFAREHPYEVPQVLATAMTASPAYARWVCTEVQGTAG